jgi:hypothetical protein
MKRPEFSDVTDDLKGFGSLAGPGVESHYKAHDSLDQNGQGVTYQVACDSCGGPNGVTVGFDEFAVGAMRLLPPRWGARGGGMHPNVPCVYCQMVLPLVITPDECTRQLRAGIMAKKVSQAQIQHWQQQVAAMVPRRV